MKFLSMHRFPFAAIFLSSLLFIFPQFVLSADSITVKGLFKGAALLIIDGKQVLLKEGKTKEGIKLIQATSRDALLEINGQRQRVGLSKQVGGNYQASQRKKVRIVSQQGGHHWVRGQINGRNVDFVVDTGASLISMNLSTAKRLGIDYKNGQQGYISTANGIKETRLVTLPKVTVGEITQYNVKASVSLDDALPVTLLGNSFLSRMNMTVENGVMVLESK